MGHILSARKMHWMLEMSFAACAIFLGFFFQNHLTLKSHKHIHTCQMDCLEWRTIPASWKASDSLYFQKSSESSEEVKCNDHQYHSCKASVTSWISIFVWNRSLHKNILIEVDFSDAQLESDSFSVVRWEIISWINCGKKLWGFVVYQQVFVFADCHEWEILFKAYVKTFWFNWFSK